MTISANVESFRENFQIVSRKQGKDEIGAFRDCEGSDNLKVSEVVENG